MVSTVRGFSHLELGYIGPVFLTDGYHDRINLVEIQPCCHFDTRYFTTLNPRINRVGADG